MKNVNDAEEQEYLNKVKQEIRDRVVITNPQTTLTGGQTVSSTVTLSKKVRLESENLCLTMELDFHRSAIKNRDSLMKMFELMLDDLVK